MRPKLALLLLTVPATAACSPARQVEDLCDQYRQGCDEGTWEPDPTCFETDPLTVAVGLGDGAYTPLEPGETVPVVREIPEWPHVVLGVEVGGTDPSRYDTLLLTVSIQVDQPCGEPVCDRTEISGRSLVLGEKAPLWIEDGLVREHGIAVPAIGWPDDAPAYILALVEDPCGRFGAAQHTSNP